MTPPKDVQETMNKVVKAENEKIAAIDFATAAETNARRHKKDRNQEGRGHKAGKNPGSRGRSAGHQACERSSGGPIFVGNAQLLRKLEATETSLKNNAKIVIPTDTELINVIGELAGVLPIEKHAVKVPSKS